MKDQCVTLECLCPNISTFPIQFLPDTDPLDQLELELIPLRMEEVKWQTLSLNLLSSLSEREHSPRRVEQHSSILLLAASVACHLLPIRVLGFQVSSIAERFVAVAVYWITVKLQSPGRQVNWSKDQDGADDWS
ncbi:hypothetical protein QL285_038852 [Trifolium repens]|nr:hypothetical protein QL285_038852 [Trifolium repens]